MEALADLMGNIRPETPKGFICFTVFSSALTTVFWYNARWDIHSWFFWAGIICILLACAGMADFFVSRHKLKLSSRNLDEIDR